MPLTTTSPVLGVMSQGNPAPFTSVPLGLTAHQGSGYNKGVRRLSRYRSTPMTVFGFNPQVGDKCNWRSWTDVEPCTVVDRTAKTVTVRVNKTELAKAPEMVPGGFAAVVTEPAEWRILDELEDSTFTFSLRKSGTWKLKGTRSNEVGNILSAGHRKFYDYGF